MVGHRRVVNGSARSARPTHPWLLMASLVLAGESIYMLPYMRRSFQTSMEATFGLSSLEIGTLNALFGVLALLCYLPGGWLADRVSARRLLTVSLLATGAGGLYMLSSPGYAGLLLVHAFWGVFSILTFWAALIKATRMWFDDAAQGRAFGVLDGGRGVVGALLASIAAGVFAAAAAVDDGLRAVIAVYSIAPLLAAIAVWLLLPDEPDVATARGSPRRSGAQVRAAARLPAVWLLASVVFCAYFCYLGSFEFPAYAERGLGRSKAFGAWLGAFRDWLRPLAAIAAGLLADRISAVRAIRACFALLVAGYGLLSVLPPAGVSLVVFGIQVVVIALAVFALRGVYFALLEETRIPLALTGAAVGLVSMLAFTPDIFAPMLAGGLADALPGVTGYRVYFVLLALLAIVGERSAAAAGRK